jgi:hypothetical protein
MNETFSLADVSKMKTILVEETGYDGPFMVSLPCGCVIGHETDIRCDTQNCTLLKFDTDTRSTC